MGFEMIPASNIVILGCDYSIKDKNCAVRRTEEALFGFTVKRKRCPALGVQSEQVSCDDSVARRGALSFGMTGSFSSEDYFAFFFLPILFHSPSKQRNWVFLVRICLFGVFLFSLLKRAETTKCRKRSSYLPNHLGLFSCWGEDGEIVLSVSQRRDAEELLFVWVLLWWIRLCPGDKWLIPHSSLQFL